MGGFQIAEAYVDIKARNLMADALASAITQIRRVGAEADAVGAKSSATGLLGSKAFLGIGAAAAGGAVQLVRMAGDFQSSTERLITSAGESRDNIALVRDGILTMAGAVGYSAGELSDAMYKIESGGQHGADGLKVLQAAAEGAKEENANLVTVADAVTSAMQDYHLKASDAANVTSKLVAATSSGKMTFEELAGSMSAILPVASANHVSLSEILGDLASMTVHGESAQQAAQNLANAVRSMSAPNMVAQRELAALGLNATDLSAKLGERGLSGTLQIVSQAILRNMGPNSTLTVINLNNALKGLPPSVQDLGRKVLDGSVSMAAFSKQAKALNVISDKQVMSFAALVGSMHGIGTEAKSGAEVYQSYTQALSKATGGATGLNVALMLTGENSDTTAKAIQTVTDATAQADGHTRGWSDIQGTFNQKMAEARAGADALAITIGTYLLPAASKIADTLANGTHWMSEHKDMAQALAYVIGGAVVLAFGALTLATTQWVTASIAGFAADIAKGAVWAAVRIAQFVAVGGGASEFAGKVASANDVAAAASTRVESAVTKIGNALPVVGVAVIGLDLLWHHFVTTQDDATQALLRGGSAAQQVTEQLQKQSTANDVLKSGWVLSIPIVGSWAGMLADKLSPGLQQTTDAMHQQLQAMDPLTRAQTLATQAQNDYLNAVEKYGATSTDAIDAQKRYNTQTSETTRLQDLLKNGLDSTTDAIKRQQDQILGAANADIRYEDALQHATDAVKENGHQIDIHTQAGRQNRQAFLDLIRATQDDETALQANGVSVDVLNVKHGQHIDQLRAVARQMGFTDDEANTYINTLGRVPPRIDTAFLANTFPAVDAVNRMAGDISRAVASIHDEQVTIQFAGVAHDTGNILRATGGPILGQGTETSDSIPALLSNNEHVWSAAEVRGAGGHDSVAQLRKLAASGRLPGFATGGPISWRSTDTYLSAGIPSVVAANVQAIKDLAASLQGPSPDAPGSGVERWRAAGLQALSVTGQSAANIGRLLMQMTTESGGNPYAVNKWDINWQHGTPSVGLMQVIGPTYDRWKLPQYDTGPYAYGVSENPLSNIIAATRYTLGAYGSLAAGWQGHGYDSGGLLPAGLTLARNSTGQPERVLNATQTAKLDRLLSGRGGAGQVTVNVTQVSGSPAETGRYVALALRTVA